MSKNDIARPKVILDGKQAEQELDLLTAKAKKYHDAMLKAASVGDNKAQKEAAANYKAATKEISNFKKEALSVESVLKNINGASVNELSQAYRKANAELRKMKQSDPGYQDQIKNVTTLKSKLAELNQSNRSTMTFWEKMKSSASSLLPVFGIAAAFAGAKQLISNIISVRKEFEKYEAVLTNTLGSNKKARQEMQMLQKFAAETPFALTELTGAYVKMVNYGLKPTKEEMRKLGDLASSTGKGFDQLVEAEADAVTGQFERLKEFGIKASKEGDKITFTFKEQTTVVDNNATSIKNYLTGLGELQGVSGSMAAIAATLGGKISNMGDVWNGLMNTMGSGTSGVMVTVIGWMTSFVNTLDNAMKSVQQIKESVKDQSVVDSMNNALKEIDVMEKSLVRNGMSQAKAHSHAIELYNKSIDDGIASTQAAFAGKTDDQKEQLAKQLNLMIEERKAVTEHFKMLDEIKAKEAGKTKSMQDETNATKALDLGYKQQLLLLKQKYEGEETLQKEYKSRLLANEIAYLSAKEQITTDEESKIDLQSQIISKQIEYTSALKETVPELLNTHDGIEKINTRLLEEAKLLGLVAQKQAEAATATDELKAKTENQRDVILQTADALGQSLYTLVSGGDDALKEAGKNLIMFALEMLKVQTEIAIAGATIQSLTQPDSIATFGASGLVRAAIIVGLIEVAFAGVKGLVNSAFSTKKGEKATGYAEGGFTKGEGLYLAGEKGKKEWIAPNWMVTDPATAPLIYNLDKIRETGKPIDITNLAKQNGTIALPNIRAINKAVNSLNFGFNSRAYLEATDRPAKSKQDLTIHQVADPELKNLLAYNTYAIKELMKWNPSISIEMYEKKRKIYNDITAGGLR